MKLEQQVTNLELSQKLKELGVPQESLFYWIKTTRDAVVGHEWHLGKVLDYPERFVRESLSAFTVAELGEMLPANIHYYFSGSEWWCKPHIDLVHANNLGTTIWGNTEVDAKAKMLIWLIENNHISFKESK